MPLRLLGLGSKGDGNEDAQQPLLGGSPKSKANKTAKYLCECPEAELLSVLSQVNTVRPGMLQKAAVLAERDNVSDAKVTNNGQSDQYKLSRHRSCELMAKEEPIVQFSTSRYYVGQDESTVMVDIIRLIPSKEESIVCFSTADHTAIAGQNYQAVSTEVKFAPGEIKKTVAIGVVDSPLWDTVLEFYVRLLQDGRINCQLDKYMDEARVKIIDKHVFPSDRFQKEVDDGDIEDSIRLPLLFEYIKMNWRRDWLITLKCIFSSQVANVQALLLMYINVYLIDSVLNSDVDPGALIFVPHRLASLISIVAVKMSFFLLVHFFQYWSIKQGLKGRGKKLLMTGLMRRYMIAEESTRLHGTSRFVMAMSRDAEILVEHGYSSLVAISASLGKLAVIIIYDITAPFIFHKKFRPFMTLVPFFALPVLFMSFLASRKFETQRVAREENRAEDSFMNYIMDTLKNYDLIIGYSRRDVCVEQFDETVRTVNGAKSASALRSCNNGKFAMLLTEIVVAVYTVVGGVLVIHGHANLGIYLTQLHIFSTLGDVWMQIYLSMTQLVSCGPSIKRVTEFMNSPFDLDERMTLNRLRRKAIENAELSAKMNGEDIGFDLMPIEIKDPVIRKVSGGISRAREVAINGSIVIHQGEFIAMIGPYGGGKSTLLRLLGGALLPVMESLEGNGGHARVLIPPHLRVLHVPSEPLFFEGSMYDNLTYGVEKGDPDMNEGRVMAICRLLGVPDDIIQLVEKVDVEAHWSNDFSASELSLLDLARSFITNPEVLCIHRPTNMLDDEATERVMSLLQSFVRHRGIEQDMSSWHRRRPRTCVITTSKAKSAHLADRVYIVNREDGVVPLETNLTESAVHALITKGSMTMATEADGQYTGRNVLAV